MTEGGQVILSFCDKDTESLWSGNGIRKLPPNIQRKALLLLRVLNAVVDVDELRSPPGNRFHRLKDDRKGQYSVSINMQWRICFGWSDGGATDVEITDYH